MSSADYAAKLATLQAIDPQTLHKPNIPIRVYLQEAENIFNWVQQDQVQLQSAGLDWALVQDLNIRIGALREAESIWFRERFGREEAQQQWDQDAPVAYALRDQLLRAMRYGYRRDASLLKRVADIAAGSGHADMIQDLNDIATLGRANAEPLAAVGVAVEQLDQAAATSDAMGELLAQVNGERSDGNRARIIRDLAYTHLKEAVDEIRDAGQYVFWDNEARLEGYYGKYFQAANARRATRNKSSSTPSEESTI